MNLNFNFDNRKALDITDFEFLSLFKKPNERVYFRLFLDKKVDRGKGAKNADCLLNDTDSEYLSMQKEFMKRQKEGYGIYFVVNSGGQRGDSIRRINAHFIDMDFGKVPKVINGKVLKDANNRAIYEYRNKKEIEEYKISFLKKLNNFTLCPNIIVETKNGFHVYWLLNLNKSQSIDVFTPLQEKLIRYFASFEERREHVDSSVKEKNRVLRIINYKHLKNPDDPFLIKCIHVDTYEKYTQEEIATAIGCDYTELVENSKNTKTKKSMKSTKKIFNIDKTHSTLTIQFEDLIPFLKQQDLFHYLGIDAAPNINFRCIFHNDDKPSAVINNRNGYYKYFCNSPSCTCYNNNKGIDIIDIVKINENCCTSVAIQCLMKHFGIKVKDVTWINEQSKLYDTNILMLSHLSERKEEFPSLNRILRFGFPLLIKILEIGKQNISNRFFQTNGESIFFFSNRYLAKVTNKSVTNINKYINLFCTIGLVNKVPYKCVNPNLRARAVQISQDKGQMGICFYSIPDYHNAFKTADKRAETMLQYHFSINGMSRKYVENCFGKEFANQIYHVNVKESGRSEHVRNAIELFIMKQIGSKGYFTRDMLMESPLEARNQFIKRGTKEYEFRKVLPDIIQKYDLVYKKANKALNKKLGISSKKYLLIQKNLIEE